MTAKPRKPLLVNLVWAMSLVAFVLTPVYVLSYAPVFRWRYGPDPGFFFGTVEQPMLSVYRPVEWLMDKTTLQGILFQWADVWGVGDGVRLESDLRSGLHGIRNPV